MIQAGNAKAMTILTIAAVVSVSTTLVAIAQPAGEQPEKRHELIMKKLGVTPAQAEELKAIREGNRREGGQLKEEIRLKQKALMAYMTSPGATEAGALDRQNEIAALRNRMSELRIKTWFAIREKLTPEQLEKLTRMRRRIMQNRGQRHRSGHHGPNRQQ